MWIQICNPNLCKSHIFWITANIENWPFSHTWWSKLMKSEILPEILSQGNFYVLNSNQQPKFMWIPYIFNYNYYWKMIFFCIHGPDDQNRWNRKNCPKFFHRVMFALWIQICNPNLCKSHIFWNTANIENWPFLAYMDLITKIDEFGKIARNSFIG